MKTPLGRGLFLEAGSPPALMGILNATPDSFSDGGWLPDVEAVVRKGRQLARDGASILDIGGESTRPDAAPVPLDEELRRVIPAIKSLVERVGLPVSIDTTKAAVFKEAFAAGASMLNDVSALRDDPDMALSVARTDAAVVLMHRRGTPSTMDSLAVYADVVLEVSADLDEALRSVENAGVRRELTILDPGLGFAKTPAHSWEIVRRLREFCRLGRPLLAGPSRKRFLAAGSAAGSSADRDLLTALVCAPLVRAGARILRIHDPARAREALRIASEAAPPGEVLE